MAWLCTHLDPSRLADLAADPLYLPHGPNVAGKPREFRAINLPAATVAHADLHRALAVRGPRFHVVTCSACGESFGPGNSGYSHCYDHAGAVAMDDAAEWAVTHGREIGVLS